MNETQTTEDQLRTAFERMAANWPSEVVARTSIEKFSGEMVSSKAMANYDSLGEGPEGRIKIGRKTGYLKEPLIQC